MALKLDIPEWLLQACGEYRQDVERYAYQMEVRREEEFASTTITFHLGDGRSINYSVSDEFAHSYPNLMALVPGVRTIELETFYSPWPVLGWREWTETPQGLVGFYGQKWETPYHVARCNTKVPDPPHVKDRCGIYLSKQCHRATVSGYYLGLVVATNVIEHERGYRVGKAQCIALSAMPTNAPGWDGIPVMSLGELGEYEQTLLADPDSIPFPAP